MREQIKRDWLGVTPRIGERRASVVLTDDTGQDAPTPVAGTKEWNQESNDILKRRYEQDIAEIQGLWSSIQADISDQIKGMAIPSGPIQPSVAYVKGDGIGDIIDADTYIKAMNYANASFINDTDSDSSVDIGEMQKIDFMDMLWTELKSMMCIWLAEKIEDIPVLSSLMKDFTKWLREEADKAKNSSAMGKLGLDSNGQPLDNQKSIDAVKSGNTQPGDHRRVSAAAYHGNIIVKYVRKLIASPTQVNFNPIAVELLPVLNTQTEAFGGTVRMYDIITGSINTWGGDTTTWGKDDWSNASSRKSNTDKYSGEVYDVTVRGVRDTYRAASSVLKEYANSNDLSCCLISNLGGISSIDKTLLKSIRLGLTFAFNGINISIDDLLGGLTDILNKLISLVMGKVIEALQGVLDDMVLDATNFLSNASSRWSTEFKRCYPFDELINATIGGIEGMKDSLMKYITDWTNMWEISNIKTNDYIIKLKKRELLRKLLVTSDLIDKGISSGIICKPLEDKTYATPTIEEARTVRDRFNMGEITAHEVANRYGILPITGKPYIKDGTVTSAPVTDNDMERIWLQNCDLALSDDDWEAFKKEYNRMVTTL
jgi:hypothetical protein